MEPIDPPIYLDHAATTPVRAEVVALMGEVLREVWGNPSSLHALGQQARRRIDAARDQVAAALHAHPREVIFTGSATEGDNMALRGLAWANAHRGRHLVVSAIEHDAILNTAAQLERQGFQVTRVAPDREGIVHPEAVLAACTPETAAVSVMLVNNEIGTVQPIALIGEALRARRIYFHTDATQGLAHLPIDFAALPVDVLTGSAHKFYGPKGTGINLIRLGTPLWPLLTGGSHEFELRASTENVAGIAGTALALDLITREREGLRAHTAACEAVLFRELESHPAITLNGSRTQRLPAICNLTFEGLEAELLILKLDLEGIAVSSGSACSSGSVEPSHVLTAMGIALTRALSSLRFSTGWGCTVDQVGQACGVIQRVCGRLAPAIYPEWASLASAVPG